MTGLFFGSFNPVHNGHLIIAEFMINYASLDEVWFVVTPQNPLKEYTEIIDDSLRLQMVKMAIKGNENFSASDVEFKMPKPSYTIDTLELLSKKFPKKKFVVIMGSDSLETIYKWKRWSDILANYMIVIFRRGPISDIEWNKYPGIIFFDAPLIKISSTLIRRMVEEKKSIRYLVPDAVMKFIQQKKIYRKKKK